MRFCDSSYNLVSLFRWRGSVGLLLLLYAVVFIDTSSFSPHHHGHEALHSDSCFTDPCHVAMYHGGHPGGCQHPYHLTAADDECPFCQKVPFRQIAPETSVPASFVFSSPSATCHDPVSSTRTIVVDHADRGPPSSS